MLFWFQGETLVRVNTFFFKDCNEQLSDFLAYSHQMAKSVGQIQMLRDVGGQFLVKGPRKKVNVEKLKKDFLKTKILESDVQL